MREASEDETRTPSEWNIRRWPGGSEGGRGESDELTSEQNKEQTGSVGGKYSHQNYMYIYLKCCARDDPFFGKALWMFLVHCETVTAALALHGHGHVSRRGLRVSSLEAYHYFRGCFQHCQNCILYNRNIFRHGSMFKGLVSKRKYLQKRQRWMDGWLWNAMLPVGGKRLKGLIRELVVRYGKQTKSGWHLRVKPGHQLTAAGCIPGANNAATMTRGYACQRALCSC